MYRATLLAYFDTHRVCCGVGTSLQINEPSTNHPFAPSAQPSISPPRGSLLSDDLSLVAHSEKLPRRVDPIHR